MSEASISSISVGGKEIDIVPFVQPTYPPTKDTHSVEVEPHVSEVIWDKIKDSTGPPDIVFKLCKEACNCRFIVDTVIGEGRDLKLMGHYE